MEKEQASGGQSLGSGIQAFAGLPLYVLLRTNPTPLTPVMHARTREQARI